VFEWFLLDDDRNGELPEARKAAQEALAEECSRLVSNGLSW